MVQMDLWPTPVRRRYHGAMSLSRTARGGRPRGEYRLLIRASIEADGPGTSRQVMQRVCVSMAVATTTLDNMVRASELAVVDRVRVPGVKRPVPVYGLPPDREVVAAPASLQAAWGMRLPPADCFDLAERGGQ